MENAVQATLGGQTLVSLLIVQLGAVLRYLRRPQVGRIDLAGAGRSSLNLVGPEDPEFLNYRPYTYPFRNSLALLHQAQNSCPSLNENVRPLN